MESQSYLYKNPNHFTNLNDMRLSGKFCDVTLQVEGKRIPAHRVILAANLKYFEYMFRNSIEKCKEDVIVMKDLKEKTLEAFISFAYTGVILFTDVNALDLLEAANHLNENKIRKFGINFLKKHLRIDDAFRTFAFARTINCDPLKNAAKSKILSNFEHCSQTSEYLDLDFETLKNLLVSINPENVEYQKIIFEGMMRWIVYDLKSRQDYTIDLLSLVDMPKLTADYLLTYFYANSQTKNEGIKDMVLNHYTHIKSQLTKQQTENSEKVWILLGNIDRKYSFQYYNFSESKWSSPQIIDNRSGSSASKCTVLNDKFYFIRLKFPKYQLQVLDPSTKLLTTLFTFKTMMMDTALGACNRFLYLCGGQKTVSSESNQFLKYDPVKNSFETLTPMSEKKYGAEAIFYEGYLHVLGGIDTSRRALNTVEKYDPETKKWIPLPPMCKSRCYHGTAVLNGKLYACGGTGITNIPSVEVYDPTKNSWELIAPLNKKRHGLLVVVYENKLLAIGFGEDADSKIIEIYDPSTNQWNMAHEMSSGLRIPSTLGGLISSNCINEAK